MVTTTDAAMLQVLPENTLKVEVNIAQAPGGETIEQAGPDAVAQTTIGSVQASQPAVDKENGMTVQSDSAQIAIEEKMELFIKDSRKFDKLALLLFLTKRRQSAIDLLKASLEILEFFDEKRHIVYTLQNVRPNMIHRSRMLLEQLEQENDKSWVWAQLKENVDSLRTLILRYQNRMNSSWGDAKEDTTIQQAITRRIEIISNDKNMPINFKGLNFYGIFNGLFYNHRGDKRFYKQLIFELAALLVMDRKYFENEISVMYFWCQKEDDYRTVMTIGGLAYMIARRFSSGEFKTLMPSNFDPEVENDIERNRRRLLGFFREQRYANLLLDVVLGNHADPWAPWHIDANMAALEALQAIHFSSDVLRRKVINKLKILADRVDTSKSNIVKEKIEETIALLESGGKTPGHLRVYEKLLREFKDYIHTAKVREMAILKEFDQILKDIPNLQLDDVGWIEFPYSGLPMGHDPIDMLPSTFPTGHHGVTNGFDFVGQKEARDTAIRKLIADVSIDYDVILKEVLGDDNADDDAMLTGSVESVKDRDDVGGIDLNAIDKKLQTKNS
ncbi:MAG TPA: hypothetical protein VI955_00305, partial [Candidatus Omnitrophota bacterium]|nr:hypothetical protein [Candidatus Omnitrophota bacterium]